MIVIADTGPINYLVLICEIEVLPKLYNRILILPSVCGELQHARAPEAVRLWINQPPEWLHVRASSLTPDSHLLKADIEVGERDAILLAQELTADELLMDDMGGLLDFRDVLDRLRNTNFRIEKGLLDRLIRGEEV